MRVFVEAGPKGRGLACLCRFFLPPAITAQKPTFENPKNRVYRPRTYIEKKIKNFPPPFSTPKTPLEKALVRIGTSVRLLKSLQGAVIIARRKGEEVFRKYEF